nr:hypothetical protein [Nocardia australiensis]
MHPDRDGDGITARHAHPDHRAAAAGNLPLSRPIDVLAATMHCDFNLTSEHHVFIDLPVVFDPNIAKSVVGMPFR